VPGRPSLARPLQPRASLEEQQLWAEPAPLLVAAWLLPAWPVPTRPVLPAWTGLRQAVLSQAWPLRAEPNLPVRQVLPAWTGRQPVPSQAWPLALPSALARPAWMRSPVVRWLPVWLMLLPARRLLLGSAP